jgi:HPt (histidine-containing phosphotransfer) domain-containing protein
MDIQMPVMDGFTATEKIRAHKDFGDLPVIAMTANATVEDRQRSLEAGMNDHVPKPIDPARLFETLEKWITARPQTDRPVTKKADSGGTEIPAALLQGCKEVDTEAGIARVAGNAVLYQKILVKFADSQGSAIEQIRQLLSSGNNEEAERSAHTLKGLAGSIGAIGLQQVAARIETAIRDDDLQDIEPVLHETEVLLRKVVDFIGSTVSGAAETNEDGSKLTEKALADLIGELREKLQEYDADADAVLEKITCHELEPEKKTGFTRLKEKLDGYDFDAALRILNEIDGGGA